MIAPQQIPPSGPFLRSASGLADTPYVPENSGLPPEAVQRGEYFRQLALEQVQEGHAAQKNQTLIWIAAAVMIGGLLGYWRKRR